MRILVQFHLGASHLTTHNQAILSVSNFTLFLVSIWVLRVAFVVHVALECLTKPSTNLTVTTFKGDEDPCTVESCNQANLYLVLPSFPVGRADALGIETECLPT